MHIYLPSPGVRHLKQLPAGNINGELHDEQLRFPGSWFRKENRSRLPKIYGKICFHESVFSRKMNTLNEATPPYDPELLRGLEPGDYTVEPWTKDLGFLDPKGHHPPHPPRFKGDK